MLTLLDDKIIIVGDANGEGYVIIYFKHSNMFKHFIVRGEKAACPRGVATDIDGNYIFIADKANKCILKYSIKGEFECKTEESDVFGGKCGIAVYNEKLYVANRHKNTIQVLDFELKLKSESSFGGTGSENGQFKRPRDVAVSSDGTIIICVRFK